MAWRTWPTVALWCSAQARLATRPVIMTRSPAGSELLKEPRSMIRPNLRAAKIEAKGSGTDMAVTARACRAVPMSRNGIVTVSSVS